MISIAEYYINELDDWKDSINFHLEEIEEQEEWLEEILHFSTITSLAAKVEHNLNQLLLSRQNLINLKTHIEGFEGKLYRKQSPVDDEEITEMIKFQQKEFRKNMHSTEKEYLDIKYHCDDFLAEAVIEQYRKKNNRLPRNN